MPPNAADFLLWLAAPGAANKIAAEISTSALFIVPQIIVVALHNTYIFFSKKFFVLCGANICGGFALCGSSPPTRLQLQ